MYLYGTGGLLMYNIFARYFYTELFSFQSKLRPELWLYYYIDYTILYVKLKKKN